MAAAKRNCPSRTHSFRLESGAGAPSRKQLKQVDSLLDITAKIVAEKIPFQRIEQQYDRIPEPVQSKIVFWSFPRNERDIYMYSSYANCSKEHSENQKLPFHQGVRLLDNGAVANVLQIGFHLSGSVTEPSNPLLTQPEKVYKVSISFDRCKITSVQCGCGNKDIFWCQHVVALSLYRIRKAKIVQLRVPISETLLQMSREQLQKFAQYLITEHHSDVLPTAQKIADQILQAESEINLLPGAPDPTAGASVDDDNSWHLDEDQVREQVRTFLSQGGYTGPSSQLHSMFAKVREMLRAKDSNGARMLTLMTEQFLADPRLSVWRAQGTPLSDKCNQFWDELGALWVCVVLNPHSTSNERAQWKSLLQQWVQCPVCPLEDGEVNILSDFAIRSSTRLRDSSGTSTESLHRTVLHNALEASDLRWNDPHLQQLIASDMYWSSSPMPGDNFDSQGLPLWKEYVPTACARVDALRSHGYTKEALRLAVAIVRTMKSAAVANWENSTQENLYKSTSSSCSCCLHSCGRRHPPYNPVGWIGHPLDPIGVLFDTLCEACVVADDVSQEFLSRHLNNDNANESRRRYQHVNIPGAAEQDQTYLTLAYEVALMGLGQQRIMPTGLQSQEKSCKQEERLLAKLSTIELDSTLFQVLQKTTNLLLEGGYASGLGLGIHPESYPMHTCAHFLFLKLVSRDEDLAYKVGLRAMRLPILENVDDSNFDDSVNNANRLTRFPRWFILSHVESQQCLLASTLLEAAKNDAERLQSVLDCAQRHIHSSSQLFRLAQDTFKISTPPDGPKYLPALKASFELGLQVMRMTLMTLNWRRREMVRWIVTCATQVGVDALLAIMQSWYQYFAPVEASSTVAMTVMSPATMMQLSATYSQQEELAHCTRTLALQCAKRDPQNCALCALNLCEKDSRAFEAAYQIVVGAASHIINSSQLFTIARYMEHRGHPSQAFRLALLAMKGLHVAYNHDTHPAIADIHWACALAHSLGRTELANLVPIIVKNIQCATVLADILRSCTIASPGLACLDSKRRTLKSLSYDKAPLKQLMDSTIVAYIHCAHSKLSHISPRHYSDFIDFLSKARETFHLAHDGPLRFAQLIENMKLVYKGKRKLMFLIHERFGL
ncbi:zinc finger SWIM domain-containing protein 5-like isoform X1 [Biomphalaria pfeifferi]|uniref:Zinc finger SWIM domain-containing protein 5-like isoform X1 n=1 Tax=Biomphalaria pfeifferi TaxID=112525 RepID=A0AAD8BE10_BIOPF|nr:zinc finger SWIM domain-containing protein 5-like isoform X1 [Biomphalaria pfeifferi]